MSGAHPILAGHPAFAGYEAEREALAARRAALLRQTVAETAKRDAAAGKHEAAVTAALESGKPIPAAPVLPDLAHLHSAADQQATAENEHRARLPLMLAQVADEGGIEAASERLRVVATNSSDVVAKLQAVRADAEATLQLVARLLAAQDARDGVVRHPSRADQIRQTLTLDELAFAVEHAVALDEPQRILGVQPGSTSIERVEPEEDGREAALRREAFRASARAGPWLMSGRI